MPANALGALERGGILVFTQMEQEGVLRLHDALVEHALGEELQVAQEALVLDGLLVVHEVECLGHDTQNLIDHADGQHEVVGALLHGGVHDVKRYEAHLALGYANAQAVLDDVLRAEG